MKVCIFEPSYNTKHREVLGAFAEGLKRCRVNVEVRPLGKYEPCDIAVIFGGWKRSYEATRPKQEILDKHKGEKLIMLESAFVLRGQYWQVGYGGFAGSADFRNQGCPLDRWESFGIEVKRWSKRKDGLVVVCGQIPWDTQVQDTDHKQWCQRTLASLQTRYNNVVFRPHPRIAKESEHYYGIPLEVTDHRKLETVLPEARCFVTWNSTSAVDAVLAGVPAVTQDPSSIAWDVSSHSLDLSKLIRPSLTSWLAGIGYAQWSLEDMQKGLPWRHLTRQ